MSDRKVDVAVRGRLAPRLAWRRAPCLFLHLVGKPSVSGSRQFAQHSCGIAEMVLRGRVGHAGLPGNRAKGQPTQTVTFQYDLGRLQ
ncbi:hypothetical protein BSU04_01415 [Caballeronia sordidicola]|uniref:Uncharacterized protein n=1 Tax=Caballeronia sordidicola TaxID=196367 RepID=A0A226XAQ5_CABSO|nr:hypothetical protein BSU04_01415 [Caballeronia sordidicola]